MDMPSSSSSTFFGQDTVTTGQSYVGRKFHRLNVSLVGNKKELTCEIGRKISSIHNKKILNIFSVNQITRSSLTVILLRVVRHT